MNLIRPILVVFTAVTTLAAGELNPADRTALVDHLNQSSSEFLDSVKGLTDEQWNYKPAADVWSIAECAEHIALSEDVLRDMVENKVLTAPASAERVSEQKTLDEKVVKMVTDRSFKAKAPEPLKPTGQFTTPEVAMQKFLETRKKTLGLAKSRDDLREHSVPHPVLKELDAYQWLLYLSGHTMRHTAQIREVKAAPGFPKGN